MPNLVVPNDTRVYVHENRLLAARLSRSLKVKVIRRLRFSSDAENVRLTNVCIIIIIIIIGAGTCSLCI